MKEVDEDAEQDESGEDDDEEEEAENGSCEENGDEKPVVKRDGTMVATAAVRLSTLFFGFCLACCLKSVFADQTVHSSCFRREKSFWRTPATLWTVEHVEKPKQ